MDDNHHRATESVDEFTESVEQLWRRDAQPHEPRETARGEETPEHGN
jgi:hypothetical protein